MRQVLSLIAAEAKMLGAEDIEIACHAIEKAGAHAGSPDWLSPGEACDIPFDEFADGIVTAAQSAFADRPIDVNVLASTYRRKKLLVADMDSTMIRQECIDELAAELGLRTEVAAITERAMRGETAFAPALRERVALLKGLPDAIVAKILAERIEVMPGALTLIATMRRAGAHTALVSGGFTAFVEPIAQKIGFHETRANVLLSEAETFTGLVAEPILGAESKEEALAELALRLGLTSEETLAVGDGANDAAMVQRAGLGVGFHPKPGLRKVADAVLDHADLTGLLYLQGYRRDEFVEG
jgi:phosphoserine phosphatase